MEAEVKWSLSLTTQAALPGATAENVCLPVNSKIIRTLISCWTIRGDYDVPAPCLFSGQSVLAKLASKPLNSNVITA